MVSSPGSLLLTEDRTSCRIKVEERIKGTTATRKKIAAAAAGSIIFFPLKGDAIGLFRQALVVYPSLCPLHEVCNLPRLRRNVNTELARVVRSPSAVRDMRIPVFRARRPTTDGRTGLSDEPDQDMASGDCLTADDGKIMVKRLP